MSAAYNAFFAAYEILTEAGYELEEIEATWRGAQNSTKTLRGACVRFAYAAATTPKTATGASQPPPDIIPADRLITLAGPGHDKERTQ